MGNDEFIVRAGAVWSGVGTLAVALGGRKGSIPGLLHYPGIET